MFEDNITSPNKHLAPRPSWVNSPSGSFFIIFCYCDDNVLAIIKANAVR